MIRLIAALAMLSIVAWSCQDSGSEPQQQTNLDYDELSLVQNVDDELAILKQGHPHFGLDSSDVQLMLSWDRMPLPVMGDMLMGHATVIAFDENDDSERPFMRFGGLDMGDVTLETPDGVIELHAIGGHGGGTIYNIFPGFGRSGPGPRGPFGQFGPVSTVPFAESGTYTVNATGSEEFDPIAFSVTAPTALLTIDSSALDWTPGEDLQLTWSGADADANIIIAVRPAPAFHNISRDSIGHRIGRDGPRGRRSFPIAPQRFAEIFNNARFHFTPGLHFVTHLDENTGSYTIPADSLQALVDAEGDALMLHISAIDWNDVSVDERLVNAIIRMQDRAILFEEE